jgi:hypothetical protein
MEMPNVISPKELLYLEDMMNWNFVMNKKLTSYIECSESDEVKEILTKIRKMHKKHFNDLLNSVE